MRDGKLFGPILNRPLLLPPRQASPVLSPSCHGDKRLCITWRWGKSGVRHRPDHRRSGGLHEVRYAPAVTSAGALRGVPRAGRATTLMGRGVCPVLHIRSRTAVNRQRQLCLRARLPSRVVDFGGDFLLWLSHLSVALFAAQRTTGNGLGKDWEWGGVAATLGCSPVPALLWKRISTGDWLKVDVEMKETEGRKKRNTLTCMFGGCQHVSGGWGIMRQEEM